MLVLQRDVDHGPSYHAPEEPEHAPWTAVAKLRQEHKLGIWPGDFRDFRSEGMGDGVGDENVR